MKITNPNRQTKIINEAVLIYRFKYNFDKANV